MKKDRNLTINSSKDGRLSTNDAELNRILDEFQDDGKTLAAYIPAVTFEDNPDIKAYMIVLKAYEQNDNYNEANDWCIKIGRQPTYEFLRSLIIAEDIDPNRSFIIGGEVIEEGGSGRENIEFSSQPITVFRFMKVMAESGKVMETTDFSIDEYALYEIINGISQPKPDTTIIEFINE